MNWTVALNLPPEPAKRPHRKSPVRIGGIAYPSISAAQKALKISTTRIYAMLKDGRAERVKE